MEIRVGIGGIFLGVGVLLGVYAGIYTGIDAKTCAETYAEMDAGTNEEVYVGTHTENDVSAEKTGAAGGAETAEAAAEAPSFTLHALCAVLMDADSGRILYGKEERQFRPMASTTKIMTCILALENGSLSDTCTMSEAAAAQPKVHLGARKGTKFYLKDLLYSLMLESHNDSAVMIAEQVGGSVEGFAAMMNQKARDIGCTDTCFVTPNGLDATYTDGDGREYTHGTTAADLARIMRYCVTESPMRQQFLEVTRTANYSFTDVERKGSYSCVNHNAFLSMMGGALTGKTGFTGGAGYSYVAALEDEGRTYVIALLGSGWPPHKTYKWADARALFTYGKEQFHYRDVFEEPRLSPIPVRDGIPGTAPKELKNPAAELPVSVNLVMNLPEKERHLRLLLGKGEQVQTRLDVPAALEAPVAAGEVAGHITYLLDGQTVATFPLYTDKMVKRKNFSYSLEQIWYLFFLPG